MEFDFGRVFSRILEQVLVGQDVVALSADFLVLLVQLIKRDL